MAMALLDQIDSALRLVDREIWVVTASDGERRGGLVATWVTAASIDRERPMLLAALGANHFTTELVQTSKAFAAHLLELRIGRGQAMLQSAPFGRKCCRGTVY